MKAIIETVGLWQERLLNETIELAEKINKLNSFMATTKFYALPREQKDLIYEQQRAMSIYLQILGKRCEIYNIRLFDSIAELQQKLSEEKENKQ